MSLPPQPPSQPVLTADLSSKTVLVVGANGGIGLDTAKHFARMKPGRLIVTARTEAKAQETIKEIAKDTGFESAEGWLVELGEFASVKDFAKKVDEDGGRLDIVVLNAGISLDTYELSKDGWDLSLQVNHLSGALLSFYLIPHLIRSAKSAGSLSRLVIVGSSVHNWTNFGPERIKSGKILETLNDKEFCTKEELLKRYFDSKLLNVLFTRALASHIPSSTPLIATVVTPGLCHTGLLRYIDATRFTQNLKVARTAEEGSRQLIWASVGPSKESGRTPDELRGAFVNHDSIFEPSPWVRSEEGGKAQGRLWDETVEILSGIDSKIPTIVKSLSDS